MSRCDNDNGVVYFHRKVLRLSTKSNITNFNTVMEIILNQ